MQIEPTTATLGAVVSGVALSSLTDGQWQAIEEAFCTYAVLVFPDQHLSDDAQVEFGKRFGAIEQVAPDVDLFPVSNLRRDGSTLLPEHHIMQVLLGNEQWHTDSSYMPIAAKASLLSAHVLPSHGGQTEWADMRAAYDVLDEKLRARVSELAAYHSLRHAQERLGHYGGIGTTYGFTDTEPPLRPLVKIHPVTGRPALYLGRHAYGIPGMGPAESEQFLDWLMAAACCPPRTYRHEWRVGDVAVWDNRCVLHRARPYDYHEPRVMKHTRIAGDPVTESAVAR